MVHLTPSPLFQIRLENDSLTMHGSQSESVGCVLRGQLVLAITEPTKFKEIKLSFQGKSKVGWVDGGGIGQCYNNEEKILYQQDWKFLPASKQYHLLKPDNYHWEFELILPGTLPETIEGCQHGSVKYTLKAVAERHTFALNLHTHRKVTLVRSLLSGSLEYSQGAILANNWNNKIDYEFSLDSKVFSLGDKIPIRIKLRSLEKDLKVQEIICVFKEYITYTAGVNHKTDSKVIKIASENNFSRDVNSWYHLMEISIPNDSIYCLYDSQNDIICVKHRLKFYITFVDKVHSQRCELSAALSIMVTPDSYSSDNMNLPAYDENHLSKTYFEDALSDHSTTCHFVNSLYDVEEMNKLPSYRSIASLIPVPLADSLLPPTYDATINRH
ncbi:hypothetical protein RhiirA5_465573 [Rhizophagus irregularis]|uniref:Arrestin C-terminal-like domain-containing protein n=3 Tax=Rhizophagus irregularis TaxID=588596 RepID=U9TPW9_RHIID|nr:hypothetical protein GLOIN_2v1626091 [Rhizophagus irregularis DAOM 181602=DAOM 197198]EXX65609.1 Rod1p [Rhizophagus irregularis DAOM 197198w]PKB98168.1 hypothetical protein RhiirA5_465573 [Rhizophagus irregularis]PKC55808.1 hypothetical protein RhiirA1_110970 [Rhizophagus irregularis]PKK67000.1 hypothetical protein RhiirC2_752510 [Rhizophagus irregularis]PKY32919.1 hypothetical protein RhiirB3_493412 [Rhizophagus irregularis]|eukprot:XP_025176365.1 hypothetical protein GLOIN_2v1626091 [Rhizophagus irregularis DAOM 181602=DAOM 197198]